MNTCQGVFASPALWTLELKDKEGSPEEKQERQEQQLLCAHPADHVKDENTAQRQDHGSTFQVSRDHGYTERVQPVRDALDLGRRVGMGHHEGEEPVDCI